MIDATPSGVARVLKRRSKSAVQVADRSVPGAQDRQGANTAIVDGRPEVGSARKHLRRFVEQVVSGNAGHHEHLGGAQDALASSGGEPLSVALRLSSTVPPPMSMFQSYQSGGYGRWSAPDSAHDRRACSLSGSGESAPSVRIGSACCSVLKRR